MILLVGNINEYNRDLAETFCQEVGLRLSIASLLFRISENNEVFREYVLEVSHAIRVPLQAIMFDLEAVLRLPLIKEDNELNMNLEGALDRVFDARTELNVLLREMQSNCQQVRIDSLLLHACNDLEKILEEKECWFEGLEDCPDDIYVLVNRQRMLRAFINLLENAIKYSYRRHYIGIEIERCQDEFVTITITNYGIGIPGEMIERICKEGERARIKDDNYRKRQKYRAGSGLGLSNAINTIESYSGELIITSKPDIKRSRKSEDPYHHYITKVIVQLPTIGELP
jgi:signal transduction histidine kinase